MALFLGGGLRVKLGAEALGALALVFGFAVEGSGRELHAGEGFGHRRGGRGRAGGTRGGQSGSGGWIRGASVVVVSPA